MLFQDLIDPPIVEAGATPAGCCLRRGDEAIDDDDSQS